MAKTKRTGALTTMYQVIKNVKLENGLGSVVLDENTPQDVLEEYFNTEVGKGFIELVATPGLAAQTQEDVHAGQ
ncbi:hypothetical protein [Spirosoma agri]|uniref:Uncharacterized protein n=1 Tax=Spirosoma agri TaxID=1987381 RepID=A0A6M0IG09_9BACT|nr:hypothetical protein [Spirosoma agri]NEU67088.1 hypothetical protein [Spirosoma agri]